MSGALRLDDILKDIDVPALEVPDLSIKKGNGKTPDDFFSEKTRKKWKGLNAEEARCDFSPNKIRIIYRNPNFGVVSLWKKSVYGRTLTDIKSDDNMIEFFAQGMKKLINQILGHNLKAGDWCIVTAPKRRHKDRNFATLVSERIGALLSIPFYEDVALARNRRRVGAIFDLGNIQPAEHNVIVFDDIVTTGSTMIAMNNLLKPLGYNLFFCTGINNLL